jgi:hypothetical protein
MLTTIGDFSNSRFVFWLLIDDIFFTPIALVLKGGYMVPLKY